MMVKMATDSFEVTLMITLRHGDGRVDYFDDDSDDDDDDCDDSDKEDDDDDSDCKDDDADAGGHGDCGGGDDVDDDDDDGDDGNVLFCRLAAQRRCYVFDMLCSLLCSRAGQNTSSEHIFCSSEHVIAPH